MTRIIREIFWKYR